MDGIDRLHKQSERIELEVWRFIDNDATCLDGCSLHQIHLVSDNCFAASPLTQRIISNFRSELQIDRSVGRA